MTKEKQQAMDDVQQMLGSQMPFLVVTTFAMEGVRPTYQEKNCLRYLQPIVITQLK